MHIIYNGLITFNKPITDEEKPIVRDLLGDFNWQFSLINDNYEMQFSDYDYVYLNEVLDLLIEKLQPLGFVLNGEVGYYGDDDGSCYVKDNKIENVHITEIGLHEATDQELIEKLEARGYTITKNEATETPRKTSFLCLSTAHLDKTSLDALNEDNIDGVAAYEKRVDDEWLVGWFVCCCEPDEEELEAMPVALRQCFELAWSNGCDWIMFDNDESVINELPVYSD